MSKRVLFVIDSLVGGGAERVMSYLMNNLDGEKIKITLCLSLGRSIDYAIPSEIQPRYLLETDRKERFRFISVAIIVFSLLYNLKRLVSIRTYITECRKMFLYLETFVRSIEKLGEVLSKEQVDLIVSFLPNSNIIALLARLLYKFTMPVCCSDHNMLSKELQTLPYSSIYKFLMKRLYKKAEAYVAVSVDVKYDIIKNFNVSPKRVVTIYNAVDRDLLSISSKEPIGKEFEALFLDNKIPKIVTAGRLTAQKGHEYLLRAFKKVREKNKCCLILLGEGEKRAYLESFSKQLGIQNDVYFLGWQKNPFQFMVHSDLFVLSSLWEGFGNVIIEAMALGLPVVSTNCPSGPFEILEGGTYGVLVPPRDHEALANAIVEVLNDADLKKRLSQMSIKRASDFSLAKMIHGYETLFMNNHNDL